MTGRGKTSRKVSESAWMISQDRSKREPNGAVVARAIP